jgi:hypothetical protein
LILLFIFSPSPVKHFSFFVFWQKTNLVPLWGALLKQ